MLPDVATALEQIKANFPSCPIVLRDDGQGGCVVILEDVPFGPLFTPPSSWVGFHITFAYPNADVYPHYVRSELSRTDGAAIPAATPATFENRLALQISRRSNRLNPQTDTAALKLLKVLRFLGVPV